MVSPPTLVLLAAVATMGCSLVNASDSHTRGATPRDGGPISPPQTRVVHLARDTGPIDVYANDLPLAEGLVFSQFGEPGEVPTDTVAFRVTRAGTTEVLVEQTFATVPGREYTPTFHGDEQDPPFERTLDLLLLDDDASDLDITRSIRLAVIHVATPVIAGQLVDVTPDGNVLLANDFGFDAGANGVVDVDFDLPSLVPGTLGACVQRSAVWWSVTTRSYGCARSCPK